MSRGLLVTFRIEQAKTPKLLRRMMTGIAAIPGNRTKLRQMYLAFTRGFMVFTLSSSYGMDM